LHYYGRPGIVPNFKLKGSGEVNFHLGCGFERDSDGVLCMNPGRYVDKMEDAYKLERFTNDE
jgi:hypothetical protein